MNNYVKTRQFSGRVESGFTFAVIIAPFVLKLLEEPSVPVWGAIPNSDWHHSVVLVASFIAFWLAVSRLKRKLCQQHLGYVMAVLIMSIIPLVILAPLLAWLVGLYFLVMIIPYALLVTSFFVPSRPR